MHQALQIALTNPAFQEALFPTGETYRNYKSIFSSAAAETSSRVFPGDPVASRSVVEQSQEDSALPTGATYERAGGIIDKKLNLQQLEVVNYVIAVSHCLATRLIDHNPLPPLIIYGPPGTG